VIGLMGHNRVIKIASGGGPKVLMNDLRSSREDHEHTDGQESDQP